MDYLSVAEARTRPGLRLVLSAGVPGPWSESAKAIFRARNVAFAPVEQIAGGANEDLCAWTGGIRNAPVAMLGDEPPVHGWLDLAMLAERLGSGPSLFPTGSADRALAFGISCELCAPHGFGWARRLLMLEEGYGGRDLAVAEPHVRAMLDQYGFGPAATAAARLRLVEIMTMLADRLRAQREAGSRYLVGGAVTMPDYHWACFSQMVAPLPTADQPAMPEWLTRKYAAIDDALAAALDPILVEHRDHVFRSHIGLPLDF